MVHFTRCYRIKTQILVIILHYERICVSAYINTYYAVVIQLNDGVLCVDYLDAFLLLKGLIWLDGRFIDDPGDVFKAGFREVI